MKRRRRTYRFRVQSYWHIQTEHLDGKKFETRDAMMRDISFGIRRPVETLVSAVHDGEELIFQDAEYASRYAEGSTSHRPCAVIEEL